MDDILVQEIKEQPQIIENLLAAESGNVLRIANSLKEKFKYIIIAARGSSDNAARYAQYLLGVYNHFQVALATPSLHTIFQAPPDMSEALVIGISQSGQSPDIVSVLVNAKKQGCPTLGICNDLKSPLAKTSDFLIPLHTGKEKAVAATKTYTSSLASLALLSIGFHPDNNRQSELWRLPDLLRKTLEMTMPRMSATVRYRYIEHSVTIGRGFNYSTAFEIALKVKELTRVVCVPYSSADFKHGPIATVYKGFPIIIIAPKGLMYDHINDFSLKMHSLGAELITISNQPEILKYSQLGFELPNYLPEWLSPISAAIPGQLFARQLAMEKGLDIDHPTGLTKVTETF